MTMRMFVAGSTIVPVLAACSLVTSLDDLGASSVGTDSGVAPDACADLQKDPKNCGACGRDCLGGTCTAGACDPAPLAAAQVAPTSIALDPGHVYWIASGSIRRATLDAGADAAVDTIGGGTLAGLGFLTVDGANLFAAAPISGSSIYSISSSELNSPAPPSLVAAFDGGAPAGFGLAPQNMFIFQPNAAVFGCGAATCLFTTSRTGSGALMLWASSSASDRVAIQGGRAFLLSATAVSSIAPGEKVTTPLATLDAPGGDIAADANRVYATVPSLGSIVSLPRAGGSTTTVAASQPSPQLLTAGAGWLAWLTDLGLMGCDPTACTKPTFYATVAASSIAIDARAIYWTDPKRAGVFMIRR